MVEENDVNKAHQSARNFRQDLILLDVVMRETDGGEVAAASRGRPGIAQHANPISYPACNPEPRQRAVSIPKGIHFLQKARQRFSLTGDHGATLR